MKKITALFMGLLIGIGIQAQITITEADFAGIGTNLYIAQDTLPDTTLLGGVAGSSQTWDFSAMQNNVTLHYHFSDPQTTAFAAEFTDANLAIDVVGSGFTMFMDVSSSQIEALGQAGDFFGTGTPIAVRLDPSDKLLVFPKTYQTTFMDTSALSITMYFGQNIGGAQIDSIRFLSVNHKVSEVDAWGSMTTPEGTFDVIRQNNITTYIDSTWGYIDPGFGVPGFWQFFEDTTYTEYSYTWYANGLGLFLVEASYDPLTNWLSSIQWLQTTLTSTEEYETELVEKTPVTFEIYPNPASNYVNISSNTALDKCHISIYDITGRLLKHSLFENNNHIVLDVSQLPTGVYILKMDAETQSTQHRKLIIE